MDYRSLGRTGLAVSPLCLGTMNFGMRTAEGQQTEEDESHRIMDRGLELGLNFFDTANVYGDGRGLTEQIVGRWFAQGGGRRDKVVLATKVYGTRSQWPNEGRLSALHIRKACDASLRRLQTDHIDLYQMHHVDRDTPWDEIWQAMEVLVQQGKVLYVGSSNFAAWHIAKANEIADAARLARPRVGAEPLQPQCPHGRARGAAGVPGLRRRRDPVEPARGWSARRRAAGSRPGGRWPARERAACSRRSRRIARSSRHGRSSAPTSARRLPTSRSRGCCTTRS